MKLNIKVGFVGFGKMGSALAKGTVSAGVLSGRQITVFDLEPKTKRTAQKHGFRFAKNLYDLVHRSNLVFICVKPQQISGVLTSLSSIIKNKKVKKVCFVSIAAGVPLTKLEKGLGKNVPVIRVMPNTPALLKAGMSAMSKGKSASLVQAKWVQTLLSSVGEVVFVPESKMDAITAVSGSGPAYAFLLAESMIEAAVKLGLNRDLSNILVHQTIFGSGQMLGQTIETAQKLRRNVTSPGGTTAAAIAEFESRGFRGIVRDALKRAASRSKELSKMI